MMAPAPTELLAQKAGVARTWREGMRVLFLAHRIPFPPNKGDKIRSFWELKFLAERCEVDLFCFYDDPSDEKYISELSRYCRRCYAERISPIASRAGAALAVGRRQPFSTGFFYSRRMAGEIKRALSSSSYDLGFVFSSSMAQYLENVSRFPVVMDLVDVDSDKWKQYAQYCSGLRAWLWRYEASRLAAYERRITEFARATLLCTEAEAGILRRSVPGAAIHAIQHLWEADSFDPTQVEVTPEVRALQPYVLFTGSMDYFPNVDAVQYFARQVLPALRAEAPQLSFVIAGRNPAPAVRQLEREPGVRVTGEVADMRPYYRGALAAVMPLRIARGVQNKILEAMCMGLPVATSSLAAAALPRELASLLLVEDDPQQLAARLLPLVRDRVPAPAPQIRTAVLREFDNARLQQKLEQLLTELITPGQREVSPAAALQES